MATASESKAMTKTQLVTKLSESEGLTKKQVTALLNSLNNIAAAELNSTGTFSVPGLVKLTKKVKPATEEREGVNPFTKQPTTIKAKPARSVVKVVPLKSLKDSLTAPTS